MAIQQTPAFERVHIGFFGKRNAGKSSLLNAVTDQELSVVSDQKGTTTDPVYKTMELLPLGPVMLIDTPGFDDEGALGALRVQKTKQVLNKCDLAVLVADGAQGLDETDRTLIRIFEEKNIPFLIAYNKSDLAKRTKHAENEISVSAVTRQGIYELKEKIAGLVRHEEDKKRIIADMLSEKDCVILVTPIDEAAPKGRLILPQQQTLRDILDANAMAAVVQETELKQMLDALKKPPKLVICDSQVFDVVERIVPEEILLTSFSILMARYKGYLHEAVAAISAIKALQDGDTVLIAEGCTHHRQCNDIGTVKIPGWLRTFTKKDIRIKTVSGTEFPEDLSPYACVIHCGGCMLNTREVQYRMKTAKDAGVPVTNYGVLIAYMKGILPRSLEIFPKIAALLQEKN